MFIQNEETVLDYLNNGEIILGGFIQKITLFHPADSKHPPFPVLVFVATAKSSFWLGPTSASEIDNGLARSVHVEKTHKRKI